MLAILFVVFCKLVQIVEVCSISCAGVRGRFGVVRRCPDLTSFYKIDFLTSSTEMEALQTSILTERYADAELTSVSTAKSGFQESGGMILQMPNLLALGAMLRMYSIGSRNSASVGLYVGASRSPYCLDLAGGSRLAGSPLRSTVRMSRG